MAKCKLIKFDHFHKMRLVMTGVHLIRVANFVGFTLSQNAQTEFYMEKTVKYNFY
jgi:hypothetical protein